MPTNKVLVFSEAVKGWVSFRSHTAMEHGNSMANNYYTFVDGKLWKHYSEDVNRNTFYNIYTNTSFTAILNDVPGSVKSFSTLNYEGSQSRVTQSLIDGQYYNLTSKNGWYVDSIFTDKESGTVNEFIEKEGKWFNYIKGEDVLHHPGGNIVINPDGDSTFDQASFAIQGLGILDSTPAGGIIYGCTDPSAVNYIAGADTDDGSCVYNLLSGCTDNTACNYNASATVDDGSCTFAAANTNCAGACQAGYTSVNGVCVVILSGCTNSAATNYNSSANFDDGSCTYVGCFSPTSFSYNYITSSTVSMNWNAVGAAATYTLRLRVAGTANWYINPSPIAGIPPSGNSTESIVFGPLTPNTNYEWQVGSVCAGVGGIWMSTSQYFTTL